MEALLDPGICHIPKLQKKPLFVPGSLPQCSATIQSERLSQILTLVGDNLFTWSNWSVCLPPSLLIPDFDKKNESPNVSGLFVHQDFEEIQILAKDERHRSRRLNNRQLLQLRNYGQFEVESRDFPGQQHCWRISSYLQKGRAPVLANLRSVCLSSSSVYHI